MRIFEIIQNLERWLADFWILLMYGDNMKRKT